MKKVISIILVAVSLISIFSITANADVGDREFYEVESNDSFSYADRVYSGYTVYGTVYGDYDIDYYKFTVSSYSRVLFTGVTDSSYVYLALLNSDDEVVGAPVVGYEDGLYSHLYAADIYPGTYYWVAFRKPSYTTYDSYAFYFEVNAQAQSLVAPTVRASCGTSSINVSWNSVSGAAKYNVYRKLNTDSSWTLVKYATSTSYIDYNAVYGKTYMYCVRAVASNGKMSPFTASRNCSIYCTAKVPLSPKPTASRVTGGIKLSWRSVVNAYQYVILRRLGTSSTWEKIATVSNKTLTYTDTNVFNDTYYVYYIRGINKAGEYVSYNKNNATTCQYLSNTTIPPIPTVTATVTANGVKVNWNKTANATKFVVMRRLGTSSVWETLTTTTGNTYTDGKVSNGLYYVYYIRALNANGQYAAYNKNNCRTIKFTSSSTIPAVPTIKATTGTNGITVKWGYTPNATKYVVMRRLGTSSVWETLTTTTGNTYTDGKVSNGLYYVYYVRALNASGQYAAYNKNKCHTIKYTSNSTVPPVPTIKANVNTTGVDVTWNYTPNADSYVVMRRLGTSSVWETLTTTTGNTYTDNSVSNGLYYVYYVRALNTNGQYAAYNKSKCYTIYVDGVEVVPESPTVSPQIILNAVSLTWNDVADAEDYVVMRCTEGIGEWETIGYTTGTSYVDDDVQIGNTYEYFVYARSASGVYSIFDSTKVVTAYYNSFSQYAESDYENNVPVTDTEEQVTEAVVEELADDVATEPEEQETEDDFVPEVEEMVTEVQVSETQVTDDVVVSEVE